MMKRHTVPTWVFTAKGMVLVLALALVLVYGLMFVYFAAINSYAKKTYLKDFYVNAPAIEPEIEKISFPNYTGSRKTSGRTSKLSLIQLGDCKKGTTFTAAKTHTSWKCSKGEKKYFGLSGLTVEKIQEIDAYMQQHGWHRTSEDYPDIINDVKTAPRGISYQKGKLGAGVSFYNATKLKNECVTYGGDCSIQKYVSSSPYVLVVAISYEKEL